MSDAQVPICQVHFRRPSSQACRICLYCSLRTIRVRVFCLPPCMLPAAIALNSSCQSNSLHCSGTALLAMSQCVCGQTVHMAQDPVSCCTKTSRTAMPSCADAPLRQRQCLSYHHWPCACAANSRQANAQQSTTCQIMRLRPHRFKHRLHVGLAMHLVLQDAAFGSLAEAAVGMAGLTGQIVDVPYAITANMLILQLQDTSLQNNCAERGILQAA
jgi:hypothetical protein